MSAPAPRPDDAEPLDIRRQLGKTFLFSLIVPGIVLAFFFIAPRWLDSKVHDQIGESIQRATSLSAAEKSRRLEVFKRIDFKQVAYDSPPELKALRDELDHNGIVDDFLRLRWGWWLSLAVMGILLGTMAATLVLNRLARGSPDALIRCYRIGWSLGMAAALTQVFLLIPLTTYAAFEVTVLAWDKYFPKLLIILGVGGLLVLWAAAKTLLMKVPLVFTEGMARAVTPEEAPELWQAVREAAARLHTGPPDHIVIGMQLNFYVTELAVTHSAGQAEGRTLFLSQPLLKQLSPDEILAIIGHELGHFIGNDTRMTREFYPFRYKVEATMAALGGSPASWSGFQSLAFFRWCFGATEQAFSRERELLADQKAAELTSPATAGRALVKFQVVNEAFGLGFKEALRNHRANPVDLPLTAIIREQLLPKAEFWRDLFQQKAPHPLDSHPALHVRLASLGQMTSEEDAKALATAESETAFVRWFTGREALFADITREVEEVVSSLRDQVAVAEADAKTETGRQLLQERFPEQRFRGRETRLRTICLFFVLVVIGCVAIPIASRQWAAAVVCVPIAGAISAWGYVLWRRHHGAELVLTAEELAYSGWRRPLRFEDVEGISAQQGNAGLTLTFTLKSAQSHYWRHAILRYPQKTVSLSLDWIQGKSGDTAQTIYRYLTRQLEK